MTPVEALQKALAAEHAAVFLYGVLGSRTSGSRQPTLAAALSNAFADHRDQRDALTVMISATGQDPVASLVDYRVPGPLSTPAEVTADARTLEERLTRTYGELVANTSGRDRAWAAAALDRSALRGLSFGSRPTDFPGLD
jgi:Domain of unknown function (DUF4439)